MFNQICFFYHPHVEYETQPGAQLGLGLLSLATYAKELGANVTVINAQDIPLTKALKMIPDCEYLMLYGCMIDQDVIDLIVLYLKNSGKTIPKITVGGPIAKTMTKVNWSVMVIDGPGEDFIWSILNDSDWRPGHLIMPPLCRNINDYPFPRRDLIIGKRGGNIFKHRETSESTTILTSRGCRFRCAFCTSGNDKFYQSYNMDRIEQEIEHCLSLGIRDMRISDDNLLGPRLEFLCDVFASAGIRWRASIRVKPNHIDIYEHMKESGCEELSFGVESGDQNVLDILKKDIKVEDSIQAMQNAKKAGIGTVRVLMMMGTPGETNMTYKRNVGWVQNARPDSVSLKMFVPYIGTDIYHEPEKYGCKIRIEDINNSSYRPDNTEPKSNIILDSGYENMDLNFQRMKKFLEKNEMENRG